MIRSQADHRPIAAPYDVRALDLPMTLTQAQQQALSAIVFSGVNER